MDVPKGFPKNLNLTETKPALTFRYQEAHDQLQVIHSMKKRSPLIALTATLATIATLATLATLASSVAQTYSDNAVGFVTKTVPPNGFALISNPLIAPDNSINAIFSPAPSGTSVFRACPTSTDFRRARKTKFS